jgi:hypothetical protein
MTKIDLTEVIGKSVLPIPIAIGTKGSLIFLDFSL